MSRDSYRSIGAIAGLSLAMVAMVLMSQGGVIAGALFGAGGAVLGGMLGERLHAMRNS